MSITRLKRKILTIHDFENDFFPTYLQLCVQIGQLFEAQQVFEKCMKTVKSLFSKENDVDFEFFRKFKV